MTQTWQGLVKEARDLILAGNLDEGWLEDVESKDNIFPDVDYRVYAT